MRTFRYSDATSDKFWNIEVSGTNFTVTYGKIGSTGRSQTKTVATAEQAAAAADTMIANKLRTGYVETTPKPAAAEAGHAGAFESALADDPHNLATRAVYADYLAEQGDPRGEFMQVQIALEDESLSRDARAAFTLREAALLKNHEREWLGDLAPHLLDRVSFEEAEEDDRRRQPATEHRWRCGTLADLKVGCLTVRLAQALFAAPVTRFLDRLHVVSTASYLDMGDETTPRRVPGTSRDSDEWLELLGAPLLRSLRVFQMGDHDGEPPEDGWGDNHTYARGLERLIAEMTRIEELHLLCKDYDRAALFALPNLTRLRVLRLYALGDPNWSEEHDIELDILAGNKALTSLTHLMVHPHVADSSVLPLGRVVPVFRSPHLPSLTHLQLRLSDMGDEGVREVIASGILKRLKVLDLRHGCITDKGAELFAACPDAKRLDRLDLSRTGVTAAGLAALQKAGVKAVAKNPLTARELSGGEYLYEGDGE